MNNTPTQKQLEAALETLQKADLHFLDCNGALYDLASCRFEDMFVFSPEGVIWRAYDEEGYNADYELPENTLNCRLKTIEGRLDSLLSSKEYYQGLFLDRKASGRYSESYLLELEEEMQRDVAVIDKKIERLRSLVPTKVLVFKESRTDHESRCSDDDLSFDDIHN